MTAWTGPAIIDLRGKLRLRRVLRELAAGGVVRYRSRQGDVWVSAEPPESVRGALDLLPASPRAPRQPHSPDVRDRALALLHTGHLTLPEVARALRVPESTVQGWQADAAGSRR